MTASGRAHDAALLGLQFDRFQRLKAVAQLVEQTVAPGSLVADIGGYPCELVAFLPGHRIVVADLPRKGVGRYVCAEGAHLPFADGSFDSVVSADVIEHIPPPRRPAFVRELFRVSRRWVILAVPRGDGDVREAEWAVDEYYGSLHGTAHPWLADHFSMGVPTRDEMAAMLHECGARFCRHPNGYLPRWRIAMLANRYLESTAEAPRRLARFNTLYNATYAVCDAVEPAYRDVYAATRGDAPFPVPSSPPPAPSDGLLWSAFLRSAEDADLSLPAFPSVTAVVVSHNHEALLQACIEALRASKGVDPEIIVVDNGSHDGSVRVALEAGATVLRAGCNRGFAAAFNLGWRTGRGEIVVSVNPDVVVDPDALEELVQACVENGEAAVAGALLWNDDGTQVIHAGGEVLANCCTTHLGRGAPTVPAEIRSVDYVTGALMAIKRPVLEALGGLDERYWPAYYEETDFCARARTRGWRVLYWPWATARHRESISLGSQSLAFFRAYHTGRLRYVSAHVPVLHARAFWRAERAFRAGRSSTDVEIIGLRQAWRGWWWRIPLAVATRPLKGWMKWRRS